MQLCQSVLKSFCQIACLSVRYKLAVYFWLIILFQHLLNFEAVGYIIASTSFSLGMKSVFGYMIYYPLPSHFFINSEF